MEGHSKISGGGAAQESGGLAADARTLWRFHGAELGAWESVKQRSEVVRFLFRDSSSEGWGSQWKVQVQVEMQTEAIFWIQDPDGTWVGKSTWHAKSGTESRDLGKWERKVSLVLQGKAGRKWEEGTGGIGRNQRQHLASRTALSEAGTLGGAYKGAI